MIIKIFLNVVTNIRRIFRSWTSLSLLIIGPLLIIGLLALAFSSSGFKDVKVGYFNQDNVDLNNVLSSLRSLGQFIPYSDISSCQYDLKHQRVHGCIHITRISQDQIFIDSYFDNAREVLSLIILDNIKAAFLRQEDIVVQTSTENLFGQITDMIKFLRESVVSIDGYIGDLEQQKQILTTTKETITSSSKVYGTQLNDINTKLSDLKSKKRLLDLQLDTSFISTKESIVKSIGLLEDSIDDVSRLQDPSLSLNFGKYLSGLRDTKKSLDKTSDDVDSMLDSLDVAFRDIDNLIIQLSNSKYKFTEINDKLSAAISDIDVKIKTLKNIKVKINDDANKFERLISKGAYTLLNPLEFQYKPLFGGSARIKELENSPQISQEKKAQLSNFGSIQILFPLIIVILISFISIILSNIIVLDELDSPAYFRSFLLPINRVVFLISLFITSFIITLFQALVLLYVAHYSFFLDILNNMSTIFPIVIALSAIYILYGMIIAYILRSRTSSLLVCTFSLIITFVLSGAVFPIERMSLIMSIVASKLPLTVTLSMLQQTLFYGIQLNEMVYLFNILLQHIIITFILVLLIRYFSERRKIGG